MRRNHSKGKLSNFSVVDYVLVARNELYTGEQLSLRCRDPLQIVKSLSEYVSQVQYLFNGKVMDMHGTLLRFYHDVFRDERSILSHVLKSETVIPVARLLRLHNDDENLFVSIRWKGLDSTEYTLEPLKQVYEDVSDLLVKLKNCKTIPRHLTENARAMIGIDGGL